MPRAAKRKKRVSKRMMAIWTLALLVFMIQALIYTWCRVQCVQIGYALTDENNKQQELKTINNSLKIEMARLKAPETLYRVARDQLALDMPEPGQIVVIP